MKIEMGKSRSGDWLKFARVWGVLFFGVFFFFFAGGEAWGQSLNLDIGEGGSVTGRLIQLVLLITVLSLAPSVLIMVTSFTRLVVIFSLLRNAIGTQQSPPNSVLVSLALFLTFFIMQPALETAYNDAVRPLLNEEITEEEAFYAGVAPFRTFMLRHVRDKDVALFMNIARVESASNVDDIPLRVLVPAFMISELKRAFEIGFLLFIPFLVVDMVVASVLMSMGMMMLPPIMISLPFKIIFFVLVDGWYLVVGSVVQSFGAI
jgi:flagellar biosynthetic protein FliP